MTDVRQVEILLAVGVCVTGGFCLYAGRCSLRRHDLFDGRNRGLAFGFLVYLFFFFLGVWRSFSAWTSVQMAWGDMEQAYRAVLCHTPKLSRIHCMWMQFRWTGYVLLQGIYVNYG